jgi:hypothetical protein
MEPIKIIKWWLYQFIQILNKVHIQSQQILLSNRVGSTTVFHTHTHMWGSDFEPRWNWLTYQYLHLSLEPVTMDIESLLFSIIWLDKAKYMRCGENHQEIF